MVSKWWMREWRDHFTRWWAINRKFTPNRFIPVFGKFSAILSQCKYLRFIDG